MDVKHYAKTIDRIMKRTRENLAANQRLDSFADPDATIIELARIALAAKPPKKKRPGPRPLRVFVYLPLRGTVVLLKDAPDEIMRIIRTQPERPDDRGLQ